MPTPTSPTPSSAAELKNIFGFGLAAEWFWGGPNELFGEVLGNTAASTNAESGTETGERRPKPQVERSA